MKISRIFCISHLAIFSVVYVSAQQAKPPIMGWSSWNNFRIDINEKLIREQADALISTGLYDAGYRYINIDDGYFWGRDSIGNLLTDTIKFPSGMRHLVEYIHNKGLKAGIYTDAGENTCGSIYDNDKNGIGVGIYGHIEQDTRLFFKDWGFNFLKVDWCGGEQMNLSEEEEYTKIIDAVKSIDSSIVFNICRWQFPGEWALKKADSWRISQDIRENFKSILAIIDINRDLYKYASPGHYNDMDMLQVGRGMSYEEDKTHFSMWCMLNSPLLAGNDLRNMSTETIQILTNKELISIHQDPALQQAKCISAEGGIEIWEKTLFSEKGKTTAIAIMNRNEEKVKYQVSPKKLNAGRTCMIRDLWLHKDLGELGKERSLVLPAHGIIVLKIEHN
ncbi:glycoside hydrolase family 27 protein [Olivibacter sitiensis]|uniref:glycoside hydrolase family 27 protein n=1 Tax=Olivibacter sitiensis TaxID=376470 RepID=UPI0004156530|nr:glycoside hydrolase family 27 protein [Olivibacter sitiensis]